MMTNLYNTRSVLQRLECGMPYLTDLYPAVAKRVKPPVCIAMGPPRPVCRLVAAVGASNGGSSADPLRTESGVTCFQMDLYHSEKLKRTLEEDGTTAEVVVSADLWDLPATFNTVILPAIAHSDRELKIDMVEQGWHILQPGGVFLTLSEYETDNQFAKLHKKIFGKCGETPASEHGMAFFSTKLADDGRAKRRHEVGFHSKLGDGPPMNFLSRPGVFSYGRMDNGSRAMLEVAEIRTGDHVLDLGSGVGSVGCLASTKAGPTGKTTFIDSHMRAVALSALNAKANGIPNTNVIASQTLAGLGMGEYDVVLANPPYYGDSVVARLFIEGARDLLRPGGRFYIVSKMPTAVVPQIFEVFGGCDVLENRGYSIVTATA